MLWGEGAPTLGHCRLSIGCRQGRPGPNHPGTQSSARRTGQSQGCPGPLARPHTQTGEPRPGGTRHAGGQGWGVSAEEMGWVTSAVAFKELKIKCFTKNVPKPTNEKTSWGRALKSLLGCGLSHPEPSLLRAARDLRGQAAPRKDSQQDARDLQARSRQARLPSQRPQQAPLPSLSAQKLELHWP